MTTFYQYDFCIPFVGGHRLYVSRRARDYLDAEALVRRDLSRPARLDEERGHLVLANNAVEVLVSPRTLIYHEYEGGRSIRAPNGPWWTVEHALAVHRLVNGKLLRLSAASENHADVNWQLQLGKLVIGERRDGGFLPEFAPYPLAWADQMYSGHRIENVDGVPTSLWNDGTIRAVPDDLWARAVPDDLWAEVTGRIR